MLDFLSEACEFKFPPLTSISVNALHFISIYMLYMIEVKLEIIKYELYICNTYKTIIPNIIYFHGKKKKKKYTGHFSRDRDRSRELTCFS